MSENPSPESTLAVILGASTFPKAANFTASEAFRESAQGLRDYLQSSDGFALPSENLAYLFDSELTSPALDEEVGSFLTRRTAQLAEAKTPVRDVLVYYVGHGAFSEDATQYYLAIKSTRGDNEPISSYGIKSLARTLNERARHVRKYLILDCCFAASAYASFQSGAPLQAVREQTLEEFPDRGTALLCASGARDPALAPPGEQYTMFSGALLEVLKSGAGDEAERFSLRQVGEMVRAQLRDRFRDGAARPEVLVPDQRQGDLSKLPLFPNAALRGNRLLLSLQRLEATVDSLDASVGSLRDAQVAAGCASRGVDRAASRAGRSGQLRPGKRPRPSGRRAPAGRSVRERVGVPRRPDQGAMG